MCTLINVIARGIADSFAVFLLPMAREFRVERATLTGIFSVYMLAQGFAAPAIGALFDRLGPRAVYGAGFVAFALAYLVAGMAQSVWHLYVALGLLAGIGVSALGIVPASALVSRWFQARLPRAMGVLYAALGVGLLLLAPVSQWLIDAFGWRNAYYTFGTVLVAALPLVLLAPWRRIAAGHPGYVVKPRQDRAEDGQWNLLRAVRTPVFWGLFGVYFATSVTTFTVNVQAVAYLVDVGYSAIEAATVYGVAGALSVVGMLGSGLLAERYSERAVATFSYSCTLLGICALAALQWQPSYVVLLAFVLLFGSMQGSRAPLIATLVARMFSGAGIGSIYGGLTLGMGLGAATGAWLAGYLHDVTGGYGAGFLLGASGAVAGIVLFWTVRVPKSS